jgi:acetyl/propionyl-CoA carboxylase alpha subunit/acetyl-CoA carboxylase carboxyltransferase component
MKILVANRGEIALRIMRAAAELDYQSIAVFSEDDVSSLHTKRADEAIPLKGIGPLAYLDIEQLIAAARETGCDAIHPGYGFLSENSEFAGRCQEEGITFVGPRVDTLEILGDKSQARVLAQKCGISLMSGSLQSVTLEQAREFYSTLGDGKDMMIKAVSGGGGRGMRIVNAMDELEEAFTRCQSEAKAAFGNEAVYVEQFMSPARHIEVQIVGDGNGQVVHLHERECTIQRNNQKLIEVAPSPGLPTELRDRLLADAVLLAKEVKYLNLGTFEFVVEADTKRKNASYAFIEANTRLQVEHTVTEEITGVDLVQIQLQLAAGKTFDELGLDPENPPSPSGFAMQVRVNMETIEADGSVRPGGGTITAFDPPSGRGVRTDTCGYVGYQTSPNFDSLLAKVIGFSPSQDFSQTINRTYRALSEFRIEGVRTNISFLQSLLQHPDFIANRISTGFVVDHLEELVKMDNTVHQKLFFGGHSAGSQDGTRVDHAGIKVDANDPLAVLDYGRNGNGTAPAAEAPQPSNEYRTFDIPQQEGVTVIQSHLQGTIVSIDIVEGELVRKGQQILVMNSMKMEHVIKSPISGLIRQITVAEGDAVYEEQPLVFIEEQEIEGADLDETEEIDLDYIRPDLAEVYARQAKLGDDQKPEKVQKRKDRGQRTARENITDLCDDGTFEEYGGLIVAARQRRNTMEELIDQTPADGMVAGVGRVNGKWFKDDRARCMVLSYDYMVLAGTQGKMNHFKKDRMFRLAENWRLPIVFFTEGGGGRPGDTDGVGVSGINLPTFYLYPKLSGLVPLVGINSGRCFAGNASMLGCCDVVIAAKNSNIGMGGPAMVEGGGLGVFKPEDIGSMDVQVANGVVDIAVEDEFEAVQVAQQYLSYFQGAIEEWDCPDQRQLRAIIPEDRLRIYDVREVIETIADTGSVLEIRRHFGHGMVTAFIRIEGRPIGVIANNPNYLSGAIDSPAADKATRFMQICDNFDIPILSLCDTPGIMVGPEVEKTALVRHCSRMFVAGANVTVPFITIILRKCYGLGAVAMVAGSSMTPLSVVAWPTGEFGGMGLEGSVKLGYRNELAAIEDPAERKQRYDDMVAAAYERGKALNAATWYEIDNVIDPKDSRRVITRALNSVPPPPPRTTKKHPYIDTW